jgi:hypothetical protein
LAFGFRLLVSKFPLTLFIFYLFRTADSGGLLHINADNFVVVNFATSMA